MNVQKELDFLKEATLGLFNKKGISFSFTTRPVGEDARFVDVLIVNSRSTTSGNVLRLSLNYSTSTDDVFTKLEVNSYGFGYESYEVVKNVPKTEIVTYLESLLNETKGKADNEFSIEEDAVDFYEILNEISYEAFLSEDMFEFNGWKGEIYLHEALQEKFPSLDVSYGSLVNTFHVHGGVGNVSSMDQLHQITTTIELGTLPQNDRAYLQLVRNIANEPSYLPGLYEDGSVEKFKEIVIEQYKRAWNKSK